MHWNSRRKIIKFYGKTLDKRKCKDGDPVKSKIQRSTRSSQSIDAVDTRDFPRYLHNMLEKKVKQKEETNIRNAEKTFIGAQLKNDEEMLLEIHEVDLIAKEFKKHDKCYG